MAPGFPEPFRFGGNSGFPFVPFTGQPFDSKSAAAYSITIQQQEGIRGDRSIR